MSCQATLTQLIQVLNATRLNGSDSPLPTLAAGITTDTRSVKPGDIFLALRGETFDGHDFVQAAIQKGAIAAIVDARYVDARYVDACYVDACYEPTSATHSSTVPLLQVPDTLAAYQAIAHWWRNQFTIPVIAVTGSVGKTTTKELIAAVLEKLGSPSPGAISPILKSQANFNNEIGVPKTLLEMGPEHHYAIVEMGMRGAGEIALLSKIARPDIAVITNVGTAHIGRLGSEQAIAQAKCELLETMPTSSIAILNADNPLLLQMAANVWQGKTITFGLDRGDVQGRLLDADLWVDDCKLPLPLPGRHNALNYLAALAVAQVLGLSWQPLTQGVSVELPGGRAKRYELPGDVLLLDETYNAGLESMLASLHLLAETPGKRHIAVLGTMKELGDRSPEFHRQVGETAQKLQLDHLLILAEPSEASAMKAGSGNLAAECFTTHGELVIRLQSLVQRGDRLLFKASRAVGLDQVVEQFCQTYPSPSGEGG